jgi:hypothetical protein
MMSLRLALTRSKPSLVAQSIRCFSATNVTAKRLSFPASAEEAVADIPDGSTLLVGGKMAHLRDVSNHTSHSELLYQPPIT